MFHRTSCQVRERQNVNGYKTLWFRAQYSDAVEMVEAPVACLAPGNAIGRNASTIESLCIYVRDYVAYTTVSGFYETQIVLFEIVLKNIPEKPKLQTMRPMWEKQKITAFMSD